MTDSSDPRIKEAEDLSRLLELELIQKRATWKAQNKRAKSIRGAGFVFIFLVIMACLVGGYFAFLRVHEQGPNPPPSSMTGH